jgi:hypothetical protein
VDGLRPGDEATPQAESLWEEWYFDRRASAGPACGEGVVLRRRTDDG